MQVWNLNYYSSSDSEDNDTSSDEDDSLAVNE